LAEAGTIVYDARDKILGRLASLVAKQLMAARKSGREQRVIIYNAEHAVVSGPKTKVLADYDFKYKLNHPRKGPFYPRMPDQILKRTVRGMLPYQKNSSGRGGSARPEGHDRPTNKPLRRRSTRGPCLGGHLRYREAAAAEVRPPR